MHIMFSILRQKCFSARSTGLLSCLPTLIIDICDRRNLI